MADNRRRLARFFIFSALLFSAVSLGLDSKCTNIRSGLPACNFNRDNCYREQMNMVPAWKIVPDGQGGPINPYEGGYVYLDASVSQGKPRTMTAPIASNWKAICVLFYYASIGTSKIPINIYIQDRFFSYRVVHTVHAQTNGGWHSSNFSCCLPNLNHTKWFAIEAASSPEGTVAIDYVDIRLSDMSCDTGELVCYPSMPSESVSDQADTTTSTVGVENTNNMSYETTQQSTEKAEKTAHPLTQTGSTAQPLTQTWTTGQHLTQTGTTKKPLTQAETIEQPSDINKTTAQLYEYTGFSGTTTAPRSVQITEIPAGTTGKNERKEKGSSWDTKVFVITLAVLSVCVCLAITVITIAVVRKMFSSKVVPVDL